VSCQRCGFDNPAGFRFCGSCGLPLLSTEETRWKDERKIISALFCDVVGSTERAERLDPEDVRRVLTPYYEGVRGELEGFGGNVEKFIGDAVCGLFGAPRAHGDDPERAVRAALAVRDWIADLNETDPRIDLHVRLGVATGEAVVALGAQSNEPMAWGDVINTASRLQVAAPVDSVLVDETTYRATRGAIEYRDTAPVRAKGKAEPIRVWNALAPRARRGIDPLQGSREPFVGRSRELSLLLESLNRVQTRRSPELITLVGEAGIGKSRLVFELARRLELVPELIRWRQARSSPYGDGFAFWALGEIVKAQAGILETDTASIASSKLHQTVSDVVSTDADIARIEAHLRSLIGLGAAAQAGDQRHAAFAAWRRFLEAVARPYPLVLVFEDIHWADSGLLDFIDDLLAWARDVCILVICTARPELAEGRPGWGEGRANATTIALEPLSEQETGELVGELAPSVLPNTATERIITAASGNPLYAVEYVRMLEDRPGQAFAVPESVQAIITARLDALPADEKGLLQDAAVVGRVVWPGALTRIGHGSRGSADRRLEALQRKEFVVRVRPSSVAGEAEYRFCHVLVRDVAYRQIPRARRSEAHRQTAEWLESLSPDRAADRAEMLAHHYLRAYELANAAGAETTTLIDPARLSLREAGERALSLYSFAAASRYFRSALALWSAQDAERPRLLLQLGMSLYYADMEGADVLSDAEDLLLAAGDPESAAEAAMHLADLAYAQGGSHEQVFEPAYRALSLVEDREPSSSKVDVLLDLAVLLTLVADHDQAIELARRALRDAEALGLREFQARALAIIGASRGLSGDPEGRTDLERSIAITEEIDSPSSSHHCGMLADLECNLGNLQQCFALQARAREHAERFGHASHIQWLKAERVAEDYWTGNWQEALALADEFLAWTESGPGHFMEAYCRDMRGRIRVARNDLEGALDDTAKALQQARASTEPQRLCAALAIRAWTLAEAAAVAEAVQCVDELLTLWRSNLNAVAASSWVVDLACALEALGRSDELEQVAVGVRAKTAWLEAATALTRTEYRDAADLFARIGSRPDEALAHLRAARSLVEAGRERKARRELELALDFYRRVEAGARVTEAEEILVAQ
jgi:class 3 adenylate cyclase/tetratricopeptide (TPR) repeat protein